jgi:hypothetical protein
MNVPIVSALMLAFTFSGLTYTLTAAQSAPIAYEHACDEVSEAHKRELLRLQREQKWLQDFYDDCRTGEVQQNNGITFRCIILPHDQSTQKDT